MARPIVFLSDFGLDDPFVGICHSVVHRIAPEARIIDLTHGVAPQDVTAGALVLADVVPYLPEDAVLLAVVDPGVGTGRRAVAARISDGRLTVGPDNGLLSLAWEAMGGADEAVEIDAPGVVLAPVSATFHGRDVFAPAAAHLARGRPLGDLGPSIPPGQLVRLAPPRPEVEPGRVMCSVVQVDRFGNVQLGAGPEDLERAGLDPAGELALSTAAGQTALRRVRTFDEAEPGHFAILVDSSGRLAVVRSGSNAAGTLGLGAGDRVAIVAADEPKLRRGR
jgi:S-adenosylmethionine hydrolase